MSWCDHHQPFSYAIKHSCVLAQPTHAGHLSNSISERRNAQVGTFGALSDVCGSDLTIITATYSSGTLMYYTRTWKILKVSFHIHVPVYKNLLNVVLAMPWHARVAPTHVLILLCIAPLRQIDHLHL